MQAISDQIVHLVDIDGARQQTLEDSAAALLGFSRKQRHYFTRLQVPLVAKRVGNVAFQQETVGKEFMRRNLGQADVGDEEEMLGMGCRDLWL